MKRSHYLGAGHVGQMVEHMHDLCKALTLISSIAEPLNTTLPSMTPTIITTIREKVLLKYTPLKTITI